MATPMVKQTQTQRMESFHENPTPFVQQSRENGEPLEDSLLRGTKERAGNELPDILAQGMYMKGLRMRGSHRHTSSLVADFLDADENSNARGTKATNILFDNHVKRTFDNALFGIRAGANTISELNVGDALRPQIFGDLRENRRIASPRFGLDMIIARTETVPQDAVQLPLYTTPDDDETMRNTEELGNIVTTKLTFGDRTAQAHKIALGLEYSDEFVSGNSGRASAVDLWATRVGIKASIGMRNEGLRMIGSGITATSLTGTGYSARSLISMANHFDEPYETNVIVVDKDSVSQFAAIDTSGLPQRSGVAAQNIEPTAPGGSTAISGAVTTAQLVNLTSPNGIAGKVDNNVFAAATADNVLAFDNRSTLALYLVAGGDKNETEYNPGNQGWKTFLSRRYFFIMDDENGRAIFELA